MTGPEQTRRSPPRHPKQWLAPLALSLALAVPIGAFLVWNALQFGRFRFERPLWLFGLAAVPLAFWLQQRGPQRAAALSYSSTAFLRRVRPGIVGRLVYLPGALRLVALTLVLIALALPQTRDRGSQVEVQGIDIMLALDLSGSMRTPDVLPNRLEAAKAVISDFINRRRSDKIGLVVFGRDAYTHCPLTLDYGMLQTLVGELNLELLDGSRTAIGNALGVSLARLRGSDAKSRVVILLTDGASNSGNVSPTQAARYARAMRVKVFTVLIGSKDGYVMQRDLFGRVVRRKVESPVDPKLLQEIAAETGGKAFRASDREGLKDNFEQILQRLDRSTRRDVAAPFQAAHLPFVAFALALLLVEVVLRLTRFRQFP